MTALIRSEAARLTGRRLFRWLLAAIILVLVVAGVVAFVSTRTMNEAAYQASLHAQLQKCLAEMQSAKGLVGKGPTSCPDIARHNVTDPRMHLSKVHNLLEFSIAPLVILGWLIGAAGIGSDWHSRALTTLLTYEPRRMRLMLAKVVVTILAVFLLAVITMALLLGALLPAVLAHGAVGEHMTGGWWSAQVQAMLRGGALAVVAACVAFALASIGRGTAVALGIGFAYVVIAENVIAAALPGWRPWLVLANAIVFASGHSNAGQIGHRTFLAAALFLTVIALALVAAAFAWFRQQEVA